MTALRKKLLVLLVVFLCSATIVGCKGVPVKQVEEPAKPVVSNLAKYEAPERTEAPEPQASTGIG
ncbi:hypothetical protein [Desulfuribacillus alkaliarsenatis]|uniref:Uncharacterized protein n=1 Tax=Desulfuribacillus alkaliarsenatis TaxID=766136 RepID=A0A1E5G1F4_9FIRM|nr:hypothetical protein [Desulfuribacillus alkaliarsenatis]OEF96749.1 hypothetical protein BHF68_06665 [Desulfuribacillus alkaliarsenatis]